MMKAHCITLILLSILLISSACSKADNDEINAQSIELNGILQKNDNITTYQYGYYFINSYALRSESIDLEEFVNKNVRVVGYKIEGYPVEDGPEYLEVKAVELMESLE